MTRWRNAYCVSPPTEDRRSRRTNCFRSSTWSASSSVQPSSLGERRERARPEDLSDDGSVLNERFLAGGEPIEARGDESLQGLGQPQLRVGRGTLLLDHPSELLRVQGVAAGAFEQLRLKVSGEDCPLEQRMNEPSRLVIRERRERDRERVRLPSAPAGTPRDELGPGGADDEERNLDRPVDEIVDEIEQAVVGPMEIFEDQH